MKPTHGLVRDNEEDALTFRDKFADLVELAQEFRDSACRTGDTALTAEWTRMVDAFADLDHDHLAGGVIATLSNRAMDEGRPFGDNPFFLDEDGESAAYRAGAGVQFGRAA